MTIGEKIKVVRKRERLNQIEFANRISVSQGRLSEIESGVAMPSVETIKLIIKKISCDVNWLLDILVSNFSGGHINKIDLSEEENELLSLDRLLDFNNQKEILKMLKTKI